ncbi:hypothetical protein I552_4609 [Mycobacterium xenopi 3993]|nr:hypothetical protein I552_4609 [Mycobacterium xenopi 3993]
MRLIENRVIRVPKASMRHVVHQFTRWSQRRCVRCLCL